MFELPPTSFSCHSQFLTEKNQWLGAPGLLCCSAAISNSAWKKTQPLVMTLHLCDQRIELTKRYMLLMVQKSCKLTSWYGKYFIIYRLSKTSKRWLGMGFLKHQQYVTNILMSHISQKWILMKWKTHPRSLASCIIKILNKDMCRYIKIYITFLVGGFNPSEKYQSQIGFISPNSNENQKSLSCHHLVKNATRDLGEDFWRWHGPQDAPMSKRHVPSLVNFGMANLIIRGSTQQG